MSPLPPYCWLVFRLACAQSAPAAPPVIATSLPPVPGLEGKPLTPQQLDNVVAFSRAAKP